jgi:hypothetical protein
MDKTEEKQEVYRLKIVVHTASGKTFESMVMELDEAEATKWASTLRSGVGSLATLFIPLAHALGWTQHVYLNPASIEAVELIVIPNQVQ